MFNVLQVIVYVAGRPSWGDQMKRALSIAFRLAEERGSAVLPEECALQLFADTWMSREFMTLCTSVQASRYEAAFFHKRVSMEDVLRAFFSYNMPPVPLPQFLEKLETREGMSDIISQHFASMGIPWNKEWFRHIDDAEFTNPEEGKFVRLRAN